MDKGQLQSSPAWRYATPLQQGRIAQAVSHGAGEEPAPQGTGGRRRRLSPRLILRKY